MAIALKILSVSKSDPSNGSDKTQNKQLVQGTLTLTGNYGAVGPAIGDTLSFAAAASQLLSSQPPDFVNVYEDQGVDVAALGYKFVFNRGTTLANGKLQVLSATGATAPAQNAAYSTASPSLNNAVLHFTAQFPLFQ